MNIELDEVVVQDVSDEALRSWHFGSRDRGWGMCE